MRSDYFINFKTSEIYNGESKKIIGQYDFIESSLFKAVNLTLFKKELGENDKADVIFRVLKDKYSSEFEKVSRYVSCNLIEEYYDTFRKKQEEEKNEK